MLHRYETTRDQDGSIIIHDVPIFAEISRDMDLGEGGVTTFKYDEDWINTAVNEAKRREQEQHHLPVLYVEHNRDGKNFREIAGFLRNMRAHTIQYDGKPTRTVYSDLVITLPEIFEEIKKGQFPGISVEIKDSQENNPQTFTAAALLNTEPPALKFDPLLVKDPKEATERPKSFMEMRKTGATYKVVCFSEFPNVMKFAEEKVLDSEIGESREDMPQFKGKDFTQFLKHLEEEGVKKSEGNISASLLKPTQEELDQEKVDAIKKSKGKQKPILVSSDNFILDGHHRWAAQLPDGDISIIRIEMPIEELLEKSKSFLDEDFAEVEIEGDISDADPRIWQLDDTLKKFDIKKLIESYKKTYGLDEMEARKKLIDSEAFSWLSDQIDNVLNLYGMDIKELAEYFPKVQEAYDILHSTRKEYRERNAVPKEKTSPVSLLSLGITYNKDKKKFVSENGFPSKIQDKRGEVYQYNPKKNIWESSDEKNFSTPESVAVGLFTGRFKGLKGENTSLHQIHINPAMSKNAEFAEYENEYDKLERLIESFKYELSEALLTEKEDVYEELINDIRKAIEKDWWEDYNIDEFVSNIEGLKDEIAEETDEKARKELEEDLEQQELDLKELEVWIRDQKKSADDSAREAISYIKKGDISPAYSEIINAAGIEDNATYNDDIYGPIVDKLDSVLNTGHYYKNLKVIKEILDEIENHAGNYQLYSDDFNTFTSQIEDVRKIIERGDYEELESLLKNKDTFNFAEQPSKFSSLIERVNHFITGKQKIGGRLYSGGFEKYQPKEDPRYYQHFKPKEYDYHLPESRSDYIRFLHALHRKDYEGVKRFFNSIRVPQSGWRDWLHNYNGEKTPVALEGIVTPEDWDFLGKQPVSKKKSFEEFAEGSDVEIDEWKGFADEARDEINEYLKDFHKGNLDVLFKLADALKRYDDAYQMLAMYQEEDGYPDVWMKTDILDVDKLVKELDELEQDYEDIVKETERIIESLESAELLPDPDYDHLDSNATQRIDLGRIESLREAVSILRELEEGFDPPLLDNTDIVFKTGQSEVYIKRAIPIRIDDTNIKYFADTQKIFDNLQTMSSQHFSKAYDFKKKNYFSKLPQSFSEFSAKREPRRQQYPNESNNLIKELNYRLEKGVNRYVLPEIEKNLKKLREMGFTQSQIKSEVPLLDYYGASGFEETHQFAEYQGKQVDLNKPFRTPSGPKKFGVYVKNEKGNVIKLPFGDPNMEIKRDNPERRKSFRARHGCDNPGPKHKAKYWSCKTWDKENVSDMMGEELPLRKQLRDSERVELVKRLARKLSDKKNIEKLVEKVDPFQNKFVARAVNKLNDWFQDGTISAEYISSWLQSFPIQHLESLGRMVGFSETQQDFAEADKPKPRRMLQTIVVSKDLARDEKEARKIASRYGKTKEVAENAHSFRFRQRDPEEFDPDSYKTEKDEGVALVYANLKEKEKFAESEIDYYGWNDNDDDLQDRMADLLDKDISLTALKQPQTKDDSNVIEELGSISDSGWQQKLGSAKTSRISRPQVHVQDDDLIKEKEKAGEFAKKIEEAARGKSENTPEDVVQYDSKNSMFIFKKRLPKVFKYMGDAFLYNDSTGYWQNKEGSPMTKRGVAMNIDKIKALGDETVATPKTISFREYKGRSSSKRLLDEYTREQDPAKAREILAQIQKEKGLRFAEEKRESKWAHLLKQPLTLINAHLLDDPQGLEEHIDELEQASLSTRDPKEKQKLEYFARRYQKVLDSYWEMMDSGGEKRLDPYEDDPYLSRGLSQRDFFAESRSEALESASNLVEHEKELQEEIEDLEVEIASLYSLMGDYAKVESHGHLLDELPELEEKLEKKKEELSSFRKGGMQFDEQLMYEENIPDEVLTNDNGLLVMWKFDTEENGYKKKAIIDEEGNSLPLEDDEDFEAVFSLDMLIDPVPVPGTKFISEDGMEQDFGLMESISPFNAYYKYVMKPMASLVGADPESEWENEMVRRGGEDYAKKPLHLKFDEEKKAGIKRDQLLRILEGRKKDQQKKIDRLHESMRGGSQPKDKDSKFYQQIQEKIKREVDALKGLEDYFKKVEASPKDAMFAEDDRFDSSHVKKLVEEESSLREKYDEIHKKMWKTDDIKEHRKLKEELEEIDNQLKKLHGTITREQYRDFGKEDDDSEEEERDYESEKEDAKNTLLDMWNEAREKSIDNEEFRFMRGSKAKGLSSFLDKDTFEKGQKHARRLKMVLDLINNWNKNYGRGKVVNIDDFISDWEFRDKGIIPKVRRGKNILDAFDDTESSNKSNFAEEDEKVAYYEKMMKDRSIEEGKKKAITLEPRGEKEGYSPSKRRVIVPPRVLKGKSESEKEEVRKTIQDLYRAINGWKRDNKVAEVLHKLKGMGFSPADVKLVHPDAMKYIQINEGEFSEASDVSSQLNELKDAYDDVTKEWDSILRRKIKDNSQLRKEENYLQLEVKPLLKQALSSAKEFTRLHKMGNHEKAKDWLGSMERRLNDLNSAVNITELAKVPSIQKFESFVASNSKSHENFSEASEHLKNVIKDAIPLDPSDSLEAEKNETLIKYYLREFIQEKKREGLEPIQIDTEVSRLLGVDDFEHYQDVIDEVYKSEFPRGLKEFAEESRESLERAAKMGDKKAQQKLKALHRRNPGIKEFYLYNEGEQIYVLAENHNQASSWFYDQSSSPVPPIIVRELKTGKEIAYVDGDNEENDEYDYTRGYSPSEIEEYRNMGYNTKYYVDADSSLVKEIPNPEKE